MRRPMKKYQGEIIKLTSKEILLSLFELALPFFETNSIYRASVQDFKKFRVNERNNFHERIKYLKRAGFVETFVENKEKFIEITPKGLVRVADYSIDAMEIVRPDIWDGKWRIVIFDIPERHKAGRDILRGTLVRLGFEKVQESVYAYPFECTDEIAKIAGAISENGNVLIMISEIIQGEDELIHRFLEKEVLSGLISIYCT